MKKLKNRKSGIIGKLHYSPDKEYCFTVVTEDPADIEIYKTLEELSKTWTDHEEPKEYWAIDCFSPDGELVSQFGRCSERIIENRKKIGNCFSSKEEAEKAVEKLKAWKRLEDRHFKFDDYDILNQTVTWSASREYDQYENDIKLLFGDEE